MTNPEPLPQGSGPLTKGAARGKQRQQIDFDIEFYERVLQRHPDYVDVLRCQGELLSHRGLNERALAVDRRLAELRPDDCIVRYNLACSLARNKRPSEAVVQLRHALERGYDDFAYLECDSDLECLREDPLYQQLKREFGIGN